MNITSDTTSTRETRVILVEDGPIVGTEGAYAPGTRIQVSEVRITTANERGALRDWTAYVYGYKVNANGKAGKVRHELIFINRDAIPYWLKNIAAEADKTSEEKSNANHGN